jgi:TolB protein
VLGVGGGREDNITNGGNNRDPRWSPDGRRIAFTMDGVIYVIGADGSNIRRVTRSRGSDSAPAWRPS